MALNAQSTGNINFSSSFNTVKTNGSFGNQSIPDTWPAISQSLSIGAGAGAYNWVYAGTRSVASGTPDNIDFTSLTAPDGQTFSPTDLIGLFIRNQSGNVGNLVIGDAGSNAWSELLGATGTITLLPGASIFLVAPLATAYVIDSTHKVLTINSSSGTATYDICAIFH